MKNCRVLTIISTLFLLLLANCSRQNSIPTEVTPTVYTREEIEALMPDRLKESENVLTLSVEINSVEFAQTPNTDGKHVISLDIAFQNISDHSVVFKKPRSTGFTGQGLGGWPLMFNDAGIVIQRKDRMAMNVTGSTQFSERPPARDMLRIFLYHLPEDFIVLKSREAFSYTFTQAMPFVFFDGDTSAKKLPSGVYTLFLGYRNDAIGYQLLNNLTPTVNTDYFFSPDSQVIDLNAWVGSLTSNEVEFTIPNY